MNVFKENKHEFMLLKYSELQGLLNTFCSLEGFDIQVIFIVSLYINNEVDLMQLTPVTQVQEEFVTENVANAKCKCLK